VLFLFNYLVKLALFFGIIRRTKSAPLIEACRVYISFSDLVLFLWMAGPDIQGLRSWGISDLNPESERRVISFNFAFLVLSNLASSGLFTSRVSRRGDSIVDRDEWHKVITLGRTFSLTVAAVGWAISYLRTGFLPSFFCLAILFSGISINRILLFFIIEVRSPAQLCSLRTAKHPI
jgi:hypothetical protein